MLGEKWKGCLTLVSPSYNWESSKFQVRSLTGKAKEIFINEKK